MKRTLTMTCVLAFACAWTLTAQRPAAPEIAKGKGAIVGRVLDAGTKAPTAGAVVTLLQHLDERATAAGLHDGTFRRLRAARC
jgi:hypothetical protein